MKEKETYNNILDDWQKNRVKVQQLTDEMIEHDKEAKQHIVEKSKWRKVVDLNVRKMNALDIRNSKLRRRLDMSADLRKVYYERIEKMETELSRRKLCDKCLTP